MAYQIHYTPEDSYRYPQGKKISHIKWGRWGLFLLVALAAIWMRFHDIPDFLIPGDPVVTRAAAEEFMEELRSGETINSAVSVFCNEVLNGAQY